MRVAGVRNGDQAIVAFLFSVFRLLSFDNAYQPRLDNASRKSRLIHKDEDIERIAILSFGRWDETEIVRKDHAFRKHLLEREAAPVGIESVLVVTALRRLNHHLHLSVLIRRA